MKNKEDLFLVVKELRLSSAKSQKRGLHFIITSVFIWLAIFIIHRSSLPLITKNMYTFFCSAPLMPLAYFFSRIINVDFQDKANPLSSLGILFSINQFLYILIAMWVYSSVPDKMVMVYAIIFGAHLLPYGWLYQSKAYYAFSILISVIVLAVGIYHPADVIAAIMFFTEIILCICLSLEVWRMDS